MSLSAPLTELASSDWQTSETGTATPTALVVQLRRRAYVLPYFRFVFADGDNSVVRIAFVSHIVTVTGHGLAALLAALASQSVLRIIEPTNSEVKFGVRGNGSAQHEGPCIDSIAIEQPQ